MSPKAILFDLDDTIISFDGAADTAWRNSCKCFVQSTPVPFDTNVLMNSINKVRRWYWSDPERHRVGRMDMIAARRYIVKMALEKLNYLHEENAYRIADSYSKLQDEMICLFPQSIKTLEKFKAMGIPMALITNGSSEMQRGKISRFNLSGYFEFCLVEGEVGFGKPDIRIYQRALELLELKPEEVWMVGDNLVWDIEAPQKVGIYSIWNDYKKRGIPAKTKVRPDRIIHNISELLEGI